MNRKMRFTVKQAFLASEANALLVAIRSDRESNAGEGGDSGGCDIRTVLWPIDQTNSHSHERICFIESPIVHDDGRKRWKNVGEWSRMGGSNVFGLSIGGVFRENGSTSADVAKYTSPKCRACGCRVDFQSNAGLPRRAFLEHQEWANVFCVTRLRTTRSFLAS